MVAPLLALLLICCSCPCFSSQSRTGNGIRATSPPREGAAKEDSFPSQAPETSTDVGMDSRAFPQATITQPPCGGPGSRKETRMGEEGPSQPPCPPQDTAGTEPWPGVGPRPDSWAQPSNRDLVELFDEFLKQQNHFIPSVPKHSLFTLRDTNQRVIRRRHNHLVATPQTSNAPPEKISVVPNQFLDPSNFPILMGIDNGTRCLSCGTSAPPTLMLEDKEIMDLYQNSQEAKRFTFTCVTTGSTRRFESVAFPGWFLSTSPKDGQPVRVTNISGEAEIINFYFKKM